MNEVLSRKGWSRKGEKAARTITELSLLPVETETSFPEVSTMLHIILPIRYFVKSLWIQYHLQTSSALPGSFKPTHPSGKQIF